MKRTTLGIAIATVLAAGGALCAHAEDRVYVETYPAHAVTRAPDWNLAANSGMCRLHIWVDDRARVKLHGDEIVVETNSGKRAFDEGSACTQPLPAHAVDNFHVVVERGRGTVMEVREPTLDNGYTGIVSVDDPQNGGDTYDLVMTWNNPGVVVCSSAPVIVAAAPALPTTGQSFFDEARACQDKVRAEFLQRNRDGDAYVDFNAAPTVDHLGMARGHIRGEALARNRVESSLIDYRCTVDNQEQRVLSATYDLRSAPRVSLR